MAASKIKKIRNKLKLSDDHDILIQLNLSFYDPESREQSEMRIFNWHYHIAHRQSFTSYFSSTTNEANKNIVITNDSDNENNNI